MNPIRVADHVHVVLDGSNCVVIEHERLGGQVDRYTVTDVDQLCYALNLARQYQHMADERGSFDPTQGAEG